MKSSLKALVGVVLIAVVVMGAVAARHFKGKGDGHAGMDYSAALNSGLPVLMEFGRGTCEPCKAMMPVLAELKTEYAGQIAIGYVDTSENPDLAAAHEIQKIPAQVFLDANGMEVFRHVGFFGKEDIVAKWNELGVELDASK